MGTRNRREFIRDVSSGMIVAGIGAGLASDLGISTAFANRGSERLDFGDRIRLINMMQELPADKLQDVLISEYKAGSTSLQQIVTAAALANAETFGGHDYVGYHTEMALYPSLKMSRLLSGHHQALPVMKVVHRNATQIQEVGGANRKSLKKMDHEDVEMQDHHGHQLRGLVRARELGSSEQLLAQMTEESFENSYNDLLDTVEDDVNIHRFVLAYRSRELIELVGMEHAHTMLRQCVRFCVDAEKNRVQQNRAEPEVRRLMPRLIDQYKLAGFTPGDRDPGEDWVREFSEAIYSQPQARAAESVAAAFKDGISPEVIGEAISLAANLLVLRQGADKWRTHGDSAGVHASDAVNAWRNIARVCDDDHKITGLMMAGYHTARYDQFRTPPYPTQDHRDEVKVTDAESLLGITAEAIRANDQGTAAAAMQIYGEQGHDVKPAFELLLKYSISEDGRLHAEKYYQTVVEEYDTTREAFRWRQLVALARVCASAYGYDRFDNKGHRAPGYEAAKQQLGLS